MEAVSGKISFSRKLVKGKRKVILVKSEVVFKDAGSAKKESFKSAHDFLGVVSREDAGLIDAAIEEGCRQINPDDWK